VGAVVVVVPPHPIPVLVLLLLSVLAAAVGRRCLLVVVRHVVLSSLSLSFANKLPCEQWLAAVVAGAGSLGLYLFQGR
jgi:hypothetical protein